MGVFVFVDEVVGDNVEGNRDDEALLLELNDGLGFNPIFSQFVREPFPFFGSCFRFDIVVVLCVELLCRVVV